MCFFDAVMGSCSSLSLWLVYGIQHHVGWVFRGLWAGVGLVARSGLRPGLQEGRVGVGGWMIRLISAGRTDFPLTKGDWVEHATEYTKVKLASSSSSFPPLVFSFVPIWSFCVVRWCAFLLDWCTVRLALPTLNLLVPARFSWCRIKMSMGKVRCKIECKRQFPHEFRLLPPLELFFLVTCLTFSHDRGGNCMCSKDFFLGAGIHRMGGTSALWWFSNDRKTKQSTSCLLRKHRLSNPLPQTHLHAGLECESLLPPP